MGNIPANRGTRRITVKPRPSIVESHPQQWSGEDVQDREHSNNDKTVDKNKPSEKKRERRRSLVTMLDNVPVDQQNIEERVRTTLRQVAVGNLDWEYLKNDNDYTQVTSRTIGCIRCDQKRKFLQSLDGNILCTLHYAVLHSNFKVCDELLTKEKCDVNVVGINRETVLHMYARRRKSSKEDNSSENILKLFQTHKANIHALDDEFQTPLHHAAKHNELQYATWLIKNGAPIEDVNILNATPLHLACSLPPTEDKVDEMVKLLLNGQDKVSIDMNSNTQAQYFAKASFVNMLNADQKTALCLAAENNHVNVVDMLCSYLKNDEERERAAISVMKMNNRGVLIKILNNLKIGQVPLLHFACKLNGNRKVSDTGSSTDEDNITGFLVDKYREQIITYNQDGYTPLLLAAHYGYVECVKYLLDFNGEKQLTMCTKDSRRRQKNILHVCAEQTQQLTDTNDAEICKHTLENKSELHVNIHPLDTLTEDEKKNEHSEICKLILERDKGDKSLREKLLYGYDDEGNTPLHLACEQGNLLVCRELVKGMKNMKAGLGYLELSDFKHRTPLHECAIFGNTKLLNILLPKDTDKKMAQQLLDKLRDSDGKTPLHLACAEGNLDMVQRLIEDFDASINSRAEKRDTPFFSACEKGHLNVVNFLLKQPSIDTTARNYRGLNALDAAIINYQEPVVRRLLECSNWRRLMQNAHYDEGHDDDVPSTPMRELIIFMPDIAYEVIENKLTTVIGGEGQAVHNLIYDYSFFDDQYSIRHWTYGQNYDLQCEQGRLDRVLAWLRLKWEGQDYEKDLDRMYTSNCHILVRNHPLLIMAQCQRMKLMDLDYCIRLRKEKFRRFSLYLFALFFLTFALFLSIYTVMVLRATHPFYYYNLYNQSLNGTQNFVWDYGFDTNICQQVGAYLVASNNPDAFKSSTQLWATWVLDAFLFVFIVKNTGLVIGAAPRVFRRMAHYLEIIALILCFVYIYDWFPWQQSLAIRCPVQWQLGSIGLLFGWLTLLTYMRYIPWMNLGLYVVMLQVIFIKFLKIIPMLITLICGFGFTYYMLLQYQAVYGSPFEAMMRTALSLFDSGYESRLYTPDSGGIMLYPVVYFVFILTEIVMTILITNLLIGLAVGEIPTLKTQAKLYRNIMLYDLLSDYEFQHLQLKSIARALMWRVRTAAIPFCCFYCCQCKSPGNVRSFWMCQVHALDYMSENRRPNAISRCFHQIMTWLTEKDIDSLISKAKAQQKKNAAKYFEENME